MIDVARIRARFHSEFDNECTLSVEEAEELLRVYEMACEVRDSHYSIKTTLDAKDRRLFDRLTVAVDAARKQAP